MKASKGNLSRNLERVLEEMIGERPAGILFSCNAVGILDLCYNLRLTQNHAVQAADHFEKMSNRVAPMMKQNTVGEFIRRDVVKL